MMSYDHLNRSYASLLRTGHFTASVLLVFALCTVARGQTDDPDALTPKKLLSLDTWFTDAEVADAAAAEQTDVGKELWESIVGGKINLDVRLRVEWAEADDFDSSTAWTSRIRLGYGSKPWNGLSFYVEMEDIRAIEDDAYNQAGLNGEPGKTVIADPVDTELNQGYIKYSKDGIEVIAGRQRIILDDSRFIGNVGWRQNEQTFDAIGIKGTFVDNWTFYYAYLWEVNRIFGPDADRDFDANSHLVNVSFAGLGEVARITGFVYLLDFDNADALSSNTFGFRVNGSHPVTEGLKVGYIASYAYQTDGGDNPTDYSAHYVNGEVFVSPKGWGTAGVGYELLGTDDGVMAFSTPLATLHKFNGFADVFLITPARGLQDLYVYYGTTLPWDVKAKVIYHWFWTDEDGGDLGEELDFVVSKSITKNISVLSKVAWFDGDQGIGDIIRFWAQVEIKF